MGERRPPVFRSVFAKLVAIMLTLAAALLLIVTGFFAIIVFPVTGRSLDVLTNEYGRVAASLAPDFATARKLAARFDVEIGYEGPGGAWRTAADLPSIATVRDGGLSRSPSGRRLQLEAAPNGGAYLFAWGLGQHMREAHIKLLWLLLTLLVCVVLVAYAFARRLLRPVRWLNDGVARLSGGSLDIALPVVTRDEFGSLTDAFNRMVERVKQMVQARDQLLLDVSHELRSPLTRLKVALEFLPEGEQRTSMAADVREMERMVSELLELERLRDGCGLVVARQDLLLILEEMAADFRDRGPGVRLFPAAGEIVLDIDAGMIRRVLRNVLENAVKYSLPDSRPVEVSTSQSDGGVTVRVSDDGPGIPEADLENIFEPFFRVDRSRTKSTGGYGLGLSICKRIMEAHGGSISVERNPGRGTSFLLRLPRPA